MASITGHILMSALQWKIGIRPMIEDQSLPLLSDMALGAYLTVTPIVRIIDKMAANTLFRCVLVVITGMTQFTVQLSMLARERIVRIQVMIEGLLLPALFVMAGIALLTQLSIVGIIRFVAIEAS